METKSKYAAPALDKGLNILEYLSKRPEPASLKEIATALGDTPSSLYRMIYRLQERSYITKTENEGFELTPKLMDMMLAQPKVQEPMQDARDVMKRFVREQGQSCHLSVPREGKLVVVLSVESQKRLCLTVRLGTVLGLNDSSSGLAYRSLQSGLGLDVPGQVFRHSLITRGVRDLVVCIQQEGEVIAVLACPFIDSSGDAEKAFEALVELAAEIESKWKKSVF